MTQPRDPVLGSWIAAVLRFGTLSAVGLVAVGVALVTVGDEPGMGPQPLTDVVGRAGGDAVIGIGLLALTVMPIVVLGVAASAFARGGERRMASLSLLVFALLVATLVVAVLIGPLS